MKKIVLYGIGLEGEKFYARFHKSYEIEYCIDKKSGKFFHGKYVYSLEEKEGELYKKFIVVTVGENFYAEIRKMLVSKGLIEHRNFIYSRLLDKRLAVVYGNCHMAKLCEYLKMNYYFSQIYYIQYYYIGDKEFPEDSALQNCSLLIVQDIKEDNEFRMPGMQTVIKKMNLNAVRIVVPNLYGCNLFHLQCYFPIDDRIKRHLCQEGIDLNGYDKINAQKIRVSAEGIGKRDRHIDECHKKKYTVRQIEESILKDEIWSEEEIKSNFECQMAKLRKREEACDICISDYIERNYKDKLLFYEPFHPTEDVIVEKGRRILKLLSIETDEEIILSRTMDAMEMPIYGCVKKALGLEFKQKILRRNMSNTLANQSETLEDYIRNYLIWVW